MTIGSAHEGLRAGVRKYWCVCLYKCVLACEQRQRTPYRWAYSRRLTIDRQVRWLNRNRRSVVGDDDDDDNDASSASHTTNGAHTHTHTHADSLTCAHKHTQTRV